MPVVGLNFNSISAETIDKKASGNVEVNSTPQIKNITRKDSVAGMKDLISIEFDFVTRYTPKIGEIHITGEVLYQAEDANKVMSMWKNEEVDSQLTVDVLNAILRKCVAKTVQLTDDLRLPPPVTFPVVTTGPKQEDEHKAKKK